MAKNLDLQDWLKAKNVRRVMVISTDAHLRRVVLTCMRVFRGTPVGFLYCPVPPWLGSPKKDGRWTRPGERRFVFKEPMKLMGLQGSRTRPRGPRKPECKSTKCYKRTILVELTPFSALRVSTISRERSTSPG